MHVHNGGRRSPRKTRKTMGRVVLVQRSVLSTLLLSQREKVQVLSTLKATGMRLGLLANFACYPKEPSKGLSYEAFS